MLAIRRVTLDEQYEIGRVSDEWGGTGERHAWGCAGDAFVHRELGGFLGKLREADVEQLKEVEGIGEHMAQHIRRYLDRDEQLETAKAEIKREMRVKLVKRYKGPDDEGEGFC